MITPANIIESITEAQRLLYKLRQLHYQCEDDPWFSCPKSKLGCADPDQSRAGKCNCGADAHNAQLVALDNYLQALKEDVIQLMKEGT